MSYLRFGFSITQLVVEINCVKMKKILIFLLCLAVKSNGSPSGAPATQEVCETMKPSHGFEAQTTQSPFRIEVSSTSIKSGEILKLRISAEEGRFFKGFFLLSQTKETEFQVLGEFLPDKNEEVNFGLRDCYGRMNNAVTHSNRNLKNETILEWKAPEIFDGTINFR